MHPIDKISHQPSLPAAPGRRAGRDGVGLGQVGEQREGGRAPDRGGDAFDRERVVEIAAGRRVREQQVVPDEIDQGGHVLWRETHVLGEVLDELDPRLGVVARRPLADVVQQCAHDQQIGALDPIGEGGRVGRSLEEVPVHGEAVVGVALGPVAHLFPLGQEPGQHVLLVEGLQRRDGRAPGQQDAYQALPDLRRPRRGRGRHSLGKAVHGAQRDR